MKLDLKARAQNRTRRATKRAETLANKSRGSGSEAEEAVVEKGVTPNLLFLSLEKTKHRISFLSLEIPFLDLAII